MPRVLIAVFSVVLFVACSSNSEGEGPSGSPPATSVVSGSVAVEPPVSTADTGTTTAINGLKGSDVTPSIAADDRGGETTTTDTSKTSTTTTTAAAPTATTDASTHAAIGGSIIRNDGAAPTTTTDAAAGTVDRFVGVSAGWSYSCGLRASGSIECWNYGDPELWWAWGEWVDVRYSGFVEENAEQVVPTGEFVSVDAGWEYACGIRVSGEVECWGRNPVAAERPPMGKFSSISAGVEHVCGVRITMLVECWGNANVRGLPGISSQPPKGPFSSIITDVGFMCGLRVEGEVECWGSYFDLNISTTWMAVSSPSGKFLSISSNGGGYVCGLRVNGTVECWSHLPQNMDQFSSEFPAIPEGVFESITASEGKYICGIRLGGEADCWGDTLGERPKPPPGKYTSIVPLSYSGVCATPVDGGMVCWTFDADFVNIYLRVYREIEYQLSGLSMLRTGGCALRNDNTLQCFDRYEHGDLSPPAGKFSAVSVGTEHVCALRLSGDVECWGSDELGQSSPPGGKYIQVSVGNDYSCGILLNGEIVCWGGDDPDKIRRSKANPPNVKMKSIDVGWGGYIDRSIPSATADPERDWGYSCGILAEGTLTCWGDNYHSYTEKLGGVADSDIEPGLGVRIDLPLHPPPGEFQEISVGARHACGLRLTGIVECWGHLAQSHEREYELHVVYSVGEEYLDGERFVSVDSAANGVCALRVNQNIECWYPRLRFAEGVPPRKTWDGPFTEMSYGYYHICGLRQDGSIDCWATQEWPAKYRSRPPAINIPAAES